MEELDEDPTDAEDEATVEEEVERAVSSSSTEGSFIHREARRQEGGARNVNWLGDRRGMEKNTEGKNISSAGRGEGRRRWGQPMRAGSWGKKSRNSRKKPLTPTRETSESK